MTVTPFPRPGLAPLAAPAFDVEKVLAGIDTMATQKPVAAQLVTVANAEDTSAKELSRILASDVALASRVMKLANSAYFGMRGRVTSLQFAVTVVGFTTVRTMATVALTDLDDETRLPDDFWDFTTRLALSAATLAPRFGERPQDALCLGLLAQLGAALLFHNDTEGYGELVAAEPTFSGRRAAETRRYGINSLRLTGVALEQWGFPGTMLVPLQQVDDYRARLPVRLVLAQALDEQLDALWDAAPSVLSVVFGVPSGEMIDEARRRGIRVTVALWAFCCSARHSGQITPTGSGV